MRMILLTGATGFVGRQVLRALSKCNVHVRAVVRTGNEQKLAEQPAVESIVTTVDLFAENSDWWAEACNGIDTIIHVAWYTEADKYLLSPKNIDCLVGTLNIAVGAARAKVRRFVGIGSCAEYDQTEGNLSVETSLRPQTPYAGAKAAAFMALLQYLPRQEVEFAWCRLFYLFGEGEDERRLVPYLRRQLAAGKIAELTGGKQIRDFLDVSDAGRMIVEAALNNQQGAINICSEIPISVRQLAEQIADSYGRQDLLRFGTRPDNQFDPPRVVGIRSKKSHAC